MELKSFRDLLLKKAEDNPTLQTIIHVMKDDLIAEKVIESLEKMARPQASMGRGANAAVTAFANQMKNKDVEMIRDALSHHISHYKSALKNNKREVADQHLEKIVPLMHLVGKAAAHSGGQIGLDYIPLEPWESNYTTVDRRPETGKLIEGTKGLRRRPQKSTGRSKYGISRSVPDYRYLEMAPHSRHGDTAKSPHKGGYPFEEIQVGNPAKIDAGEAYLHISDVEPKESYTPHPFDQHPINQVADIDQGSLTPEHIKSFTDAMHGWHDSEHNKMWMQSLKDSHAKDPEAFKTRGKTKPTHHFEGLKLLDQPDHAKEVMENLPEALKAKFTKKPQEVPKVEAPKTALTPEHMSNLPPELASKFSGRK